MMMGVLFNGRVSMIAAVILAVVAGQQPVFHDVPATFLCIVGGVTAALSVKTLRSRSNFYAPVLIIAGGDFIRPLALRVSSGLADRGNRLPGVWGALESPEVGGVTPFLLPCGHA